MTHVPQIRIQGCNDHPVNPSGDFVLYWMIANRRLTWNFSLQRAVACARELKKPLVVFEALRCGYKWASERLHRFIIDGMTDNATNVERSAALYYPYVESSVDDGKGLLQALGRRACIVITDDFPEFFLPRMVRAASAQIPVRLEQVDSNGLLPMRSANQVFTTAFAFRRFLQKTLCLHLQAIPVADPLKAVTLPKMGGLPEEITKRWPIFPAARHRGDSSLLGSLPIDHKVMPSTMRGGSTAALAAMKTFLTERLSSYAEGRNQPERDATSGLSAYLHFGHISAHEVFAALMDKEGWSVDRVSPKATGSRSGWWGVSTSAEAFLDQIITWRELGFNICWQREDYGRYESLPEWALKTLSQHSKDRRSYTYTLDQFEQAQTHDPLWNAAQIQLVREGGIHNYLRMLWGKKIVEWTASPQEALDVMIQLNNQYALDGRNPNSYSGIFWVLGRYDRPWGPERAVFGKIRYMSSENTARKVRVQNYIEKYIP
jgi:deoxyribodipyrimidine photo-lyase